MRNDNFFNKKINITSIVNYFGKNNYSLFDPDKNKYINIVDTYPKLIKDFDKKYFHYTLSILNHETKNKNSKKMLVMTRRVFNDMRGCYFIKNKYEALSTVPILVCETNSVTVYSNEKEYVYTGLSRGYTYPVSIPGFSMESLSKITKTLKRIIMASIDFNVDDLVIFGGDPLYSIFYPMSSRKFIVEVNSEFNKYNPSCFKSFNANKFKCRAVNNIFNSLGSVEKIVKDDCVDSNFHAYFVIEHNDSFSFY